jgi:hypothetical protein
MSITLKDCVSEIESGQWFSIRFLTADVKKGTGGKVIEIPKARIARRMHPVGSAQEIVEWPRSKNFTNPAHNFNFTRNIELPNKKIRKIHPILITHLNQQPVL